MDLRKLLSDLEAEKDRIVRAIEALIGIGSSSPGGAKAKRRRRGGMTPEGRRRLSLAMKKRWAASRKKMA